MSVPQSVLVDFSVASDVQHASPVGGIKAVQGEIIAVMPPQMMPGPAMIVSSMDKSSGSPSNRPHSSVERGQIEPWSQEEDSKLLQLVSTYGSSNWTQISEHMHGRSGMHCRQRWITQVDPSIVKAPWTEEEDKKIVVVQSKLGNRFAEITKLLEGRPRPAVCQRWHSVLHARADKILAGMSKEEKDAILDGIELDEVSDMPSQDKKRWTAEEDQALIEAVRELGTANWGEVSRRMPTRRSSIQCRRRYTNKLDPSVKNEDWTEEEDKKIVAAQSKLGNRWAQISKLLEGRSEDAVGHRWMAVLHAKADRIKATLSEDDWKFLQGANDIPYRNIKQWSPEEDALLVKLAEEMGTSSWSQVSKHFDGRSSRQCRDRFFSKLDPSISKDPWTDEEDRKIVAAQSKFGNSWVKISKFLNGRPEIAVKVRWYTVLSTKADKVLQDLIMEDYKFLHEAAAEAAKLPEKRKWSDQEDGRLLELVDQYGMGNWAQIAQHLPGRSCLQCRNRYVNQVDPSLRKGGWTEEEDKKVVAAQSRLGNCWAKISKLLQGRSESSLNGRWYSVLEPRAASILSELKESDFAFLDEASSLEKLPPGVNLCAAGDRRPWTEEEDNILLAQVSKFGQKNWAEVAKYVPGRAPKQCRHRYLNKVDPKRNQEAWTEEEDKKIVAAQSKLGNRFAEIAKLLEGRTESLVSHRWHIQLQPRQQQILETLTDKDYEFVMNVASNSAPTADRKGWKPWTPEEDAELLRLVDEHGKHNWPHVSKLLRGGTRLPKQCRDRFVNKLDPSIRKDAWSEEEDKKIVAAQSKLGNRWAKISKYLHGRSEISIKARWYSSLQPRAQMILASLQKHEFAFLDGIEDVDKQDKFKKRKKNEMQPGSMMDTIGVGIMPQVLVSQIKEAAPPPPPAP